MEILAENPFDGMLNFSDVLAFENARGIASGLMYAAGKGSPMCCAFLKAYDGVAYSAEKLVLNTQMNKPILDVMLPELKYNGKTQIFGDCCIFGTEEYGQLMFHYGTRSWCDNLPKYTVRKPNWLISKLRSPLIFEKLDNSLSGTFIHKLYTFLVYDLYDLGFIYFIKLQINKRKAKNDKSS